MLFTIKVRTRRVLCGSGLPPGCARAISSHVVVVKCRSSAALVVVEEDVPGERAVPSHRGARQGDEGEDAEEGQLTTLLKDHLVLLSRATTSGGANTGFGDDKLIINNNYFISYFRLSTLSL